MTTCDPDLAGLLAQVREAKAADQELDEAIHATLLPDDPWWQAIVEGRRLVAAGRPYEKIDRCNCNLMADSWANGSRVGSYTGSTDAAVTLFERTLPGWSRESGRSGFGNPAWCYVWDPSRSPGLSNTRRTTHDGGSEPLAILAALLSALIAQETAHARD